MCPGGWGGGGVGGVIQGVCRLRLSKKSVPVFQAEFSLRAGHWAN